MRLSTIVVATSLAATLTGLALVACSSSEGSGGASSGAPPGDEGGVTPPAPGTTTFHKHVEPILQKSCQGCHTAGGIAPFSLVTYADAKNVAASIVDQTHARAMPPWGAQNTSECTPPRAWKDDLRLSDLELATLDAWHKGGDPEGDPKDAPPPLTGGPSQNLAGATSLATTKPFTVAGKSDTFRCFVLDPKVTTTKYITATNFVPSNKTVVHHALTFAIPAGATVPADEYECFGGPDVEGASLVAAWAPGGVPNEYPADVGLTVEAGTRFVMQVHYHPHANAAPGADATAFEYRLTDAVPTYKARTVLLGNFRNEIGAAGIGLEPGTDDPGGKATFVIPADVKGHVETMDFRLPPTGATSPIWILGVAAHMHLAGKDEKITLTHAGAESCLLQEPAWNFNWQRGYQYDAPIESLPTIAAGDTLKFRCTYDNTMTNPALAAARLEAGMNTPTPITLGESTTDEMCLGAVTFVTR